MKVKLEINEKYKDTEIHVCNHHDTEELREIYRRVKEAVEENIVGYRDGESVMIKSSDVVRIFSQNKNVYLTTEKGQYRIRERLYEMEEKLDETLFVRISNSEIINVRKLLRMDTSVTGSIRMYLKGEQETYVSRRYVSKIKKALGI